MAEAFSSEDCFTITEFRKDDPRLKEFLEIELQENQPSFMATVQLIPGSDELEIEDADIWMRCHLTTDDFNRLKSLGLKGKLRAAGVGMLGTPLIWHERSLSGNIKLRRRSISRSRMNASSSTTRWAMSGESSPPTHLP